MSILNIEMDRNPPWLYRNWRKTRDFYPRDAMLSLLCIAPRGLCDSDVSARPFVCPSYAGIVSKPWLIDQNVMISSPSERPNIPFFLEICGSCAHPEPPKFDRGHPERERFLRLGWVRTGDFGDFSTYKPPYLRNGAR